MVASGNSFRTWDGDGAQDTFVIDTDYIAESHLQIVVDTVPQTVGVDYNIVTGTLVVFTGGSIPGAGTDNVEINRVSPPEFDSRLVDFQALSSLSASDLELNQKHLMLLIQEAMETNTLGVRRSV